MTAKIRTKGRAARLALVLLMSLAFVCGGFFEQTEAFAAAEASAASRASAASLAAASAPVATAKVNVKKGIYIRKKASNKSGKVKKLKNNAKVTIIKEVFLKKSSAKAKYKWYYVKYGKKKGYLPSTKLKDVKYSTVKGVTISDLNYRVGPNTKMTRKGTFRNKSVINVVLKANVKGVSTMWYKVQIGSKYYYVSSDWARLGLVNVVKTAGTPASMLKPSNPAAVRDGDPIFNVKNATYPTSLLEKVTFTIVGTVE